MKAFVGHSFEEKDKQLVDKIIKFLESTGIKCQTGERAQNKSVAEKVKRMILEDEIFIGIFTRDKEIVSKKGKFKSLFPSNSKEKFYTTSNWVIQESGYAIGKDRELIFLVESGIYKFPELQGDLEILYFHRESLEETFLKLNEIVDFIKSKKIKGIPSETREGVEDLEKQESEKQKEKVKGEMKDKREETFDKLHNALFKEEDPSKAQEIYYKELRPSLQDNERPMWEAIVLRISHNLGDAGAFDKLIKCTEENSNNADVIWQLAIRYRDMREYQKAKDTFLTAKALYDINKEEDKVNIMGCYKQAGLCLAFDGKYDDAIQLLSEALYDDGLMKFKAKTLAGLAKIAKIKNDSESFFIYGEGSLNIDPSNTELRFDLAYRYSQGDHNKLSLLHYKKLTDTKKSPSGLNNLGVQYTTLKLPAKSIDSYFKAAGYNETLSMANIAQGYLNEGFIKDAEREIKRANELSKEGLDVHGSVGNAKNRVEKILGEEDGREKEILIDAERERDFRARYSESFYCKRNIVKEKIEGIWETPWGGANLVFDSKTPSFKIDEKKRVKLGALGSILRGHLSSGEERYKTEIIKIEGESTKMSGRYKVEIEDIFEYKHISPVKKKVYEADGLMIISEDFKTIYVMEKDKEEKLNIRRWKKKEV